MKRTCTIIPRHGSAPRYIGGGGNWMVLPGVATCPLLRCRTAAPMAEAAQAAGSPQIKVIAQRPPYRTGPGRELTLDLRLTGRHIAYLMVAEVGDQEPAVGGHRHPVGI
jgi:hypothetical protein